MWASTAPVLSTASPKKAGICSQLLLLCANGETSGTRHPTRHRWILGIKPQGSQYKPFRCKTPKVIQSLCVMCLFPVTPRLAAKKTLPDNPQNYTPEPFLELRQSDAVTRLNCQQLLRYIKFSISMIFNLIATTIQVLRRYICPVRSNLVLWQLQLWPLRPQPRLSKLVISFCVPVLCMLRQMIPATKFYS